MDLVEFLTARLDEDERIARAAATLRGGGEWAAQPDPEGVIAVTGLPEAWQSYVPVVLNPDDDETAIHIARHDPARVLAEVDAKRRLLADHPVERETMDRPVYAGREVGGPYWPFGCGNCHADRETGEINGFGYCLTRRLLALPYADDADYDEAWRP